MDQFDFEKLQQFGQTNPIAAALIAGGVLLFLVFLVVRAAAGPPPLPPNIENELQPTRTDHSPEPSGPRMIARMTEEISVTPAGGFCAVMFTLTFLVQGIRFMGATTLPDLVNTGLGLIVGMMLWGGVSLLAASERM